MCLACSSETGQLYVQGKIDVEPILGKLNVSLRINRFWVRGFERAIGEVEIVAMVFNIMKLVVRGPAKNTDVSK
ncbi:transposase [Lactiplantibacillus pentosus]|uniref:transposase n=1 Tax=Lactiplantibacillus pentosus TaxID=1589 RepID=UPI001ADD9CA0|nr:transposase [Lactiplantibacillus pentosus]MBO9164906.1 transposase [Lactiplantibacillus pentosus]MCT0163429.1 hypothetical protein [Lactiplantibacillus pentosus]MCT3309354.1 hypothetical protein [Lactiplantibacillus pentosus]